MAPPKAPVARDDGRAIVMTRVLDAPRALVFAAWTEPRHMARWWGPHGFTSPVCELDVRPGGAWRIVMQGPDGTKVPVGGVYLEVDPPRRLVYTATVDEEASRGWEHGPPPPAIHIILFEEQGAKTKLTVVTQLESVADRDRIAKMGHEGGMGQSLDRLAALLAER